MADQQTQQRPGGPFAGLVAWWTKATAWALATKPVRAVLLYFEHHGPMLADSVTYRTLFSVFAGVFLGFAIGGIWLSGQPDAMDALVATISTAIPGLIGEDAVISGPDDLLRLADNRLYVGKRAGRNRVVWQDLPLSSTP